MKNYLILFLLATVGLQFGCGSSEPESAGTEAGAETTAEAEPQAEGDIDYDEMAEDFCVCMRPMFEFQEKVMKLAAEGNNSEIEALREDAMKVQADGEACVTKLEEKYGAVEGEEKEAKATAALEKVCPDIMAMMGAELESMEQ